MIDGSIQKVAELAAETTKRRPGMRSAINAFCRSCIYDPGATGNWRQQVTACTSPGCPLYPIRPQSSSGK